MIRITIAILSLVGVLHAASGQVGPENVILVVNADSDDSRQLADYYAELRQIPERNRIEIQNVPEGLKTDLATFRDRILMPLLRELDARRLGSAAKVVAYSSGFPTSVDITPHHKRIEDANIRKMQKPTAALTGLTYLYHFILADSPNYLSLNANLYARGPFDRHFVNPFFNDPAKSEFQKAAKAFDAGEFDEASEIFGSLFDQYPRQSPLAIRTAECNALIDKEDVAAIWVRRAIAAGWKSSRYLRESESLAPVVKRSTLKSLVARLDDRPLTAQQAMRFSGQRTWAPNGHMHTTTDEGLRYMLCCMLAVLHERGSTLEQAKSVLRRASKADETNPTGKFWFTQTGDIRTKTRFDAMDDSLQWLKTLGQGAAVIQHSMPKGEGRCNGLMLGTPTMKLQGRRWSFVPGAISENLTSFSAAFGRASQSKITELLHAGAALSGGAVEEPYAIAPKFPSPMLYSYYAEGLTGIEAYYLSIQSPYQYLIVGDPLVRAFSRDKGAEAN